tara:strand:- start:5 stop:679 length:675 start_codon:yes stop_codon:yes gene_type:complete
MISWLKGKIIKKWYISTKKGVVLNVNGVGYEVNALLKHLSKIDNSNFQEFWIHQINREDGSTLYGFIDINQRDLFRKIISVNGIGPQIGMALLEDNEVSQFISAIQNNDINLLTKSQGVGKRIAERLVVDLKNKLQDFTNNQEIINHKHRTNESNNFAQYRYEITSILNSLGYVDQEIKDSIDEIVTNEKENILLINSLSAEAKSDLIDKHLKKILIRLSQKST